jgi:hypothetical protein
MAATGKVVFVLGAGFTRAFLPRAPLATDDYGAAELARRLPGYPHARRILLQEMERNGDGTINIERLLTRLAGGMPYDQDRGTTAEMELLAAELMRAFVRRIEGALTGTRYRDDVLAFARHCIRVGITCLTFNCDDLVDRALYDASQDPSGALGSGWHPDMGYGFVCPSSATCVHADELRITSSPMLLLKLHGSLNWRFKLGAKPPYTIDSLVHHEDWCDVPRTTTGVNQDWMERHLAPDPFIAPPVLAQATFTEQPIFGRLWSLAYQALEQAERVVFLGYSLPSADVAATFLFREACGHLRPAQVHVVNLASSEDARRDLHAAYRQAFPGITLAQFAFQDAREWSRVWCTPAGESAS